MMEPDWTALQTDLVVCISSLLIADDLADFIRFRAVCHPWRSSTEETKHRADFLHPRNWIMLSNPKLSPTEPIEFYNTSTHKSFWFDLTSYLDGYSLFRSFVCLILLRNTSTGGLALLSPLMRSITKLPSNIESNCPRAPAKFEDLMHHIHWISDVYITSSSTIVLSNSDYLVWTKPGDESWMYAKLEVQCLSNVLFHDDRFFFVDFDMRVMQINLSNEMSTQPQLEVVIPDKSALKFLKYY